MDIITRLEETILISIWKLKDNAYGVTINLSVSEQTGKEYTMGALYFSLDQLFKKGHLSKKTGNPTQERGGRSKIYYTLTDSGKNALVKAKDMQESMWKDVSKASIQEG